LERLKPRDRKQQIIDAAVESAILNGGCKALTRENIAVLAKCSVGLINHYFGTIELLKEEVIKKAISSAIPMLIAEAILDKSPLVADIHKDLRTKAANSILS